MSLVFFLLFLQPFDPGLHFIFIAGKKEHVNHFHQIMNHVYTRIVNVLSCLGWCFGIGLCGDTLNQNNHDYGLNYTNPLSPSSFGNLFLEIFTLKLQSCSIRDMH